MDTKLFPPVAVQNPEFHNICWRDAMTAEGVIHSSSWFKLGTTPQGLLIKRERTGEEKETERARERGGVNERLWWCFVQDFQLQKQHERRSVGSRSSLKYLLSSTVQYLITIINKILALMGCTSFFTKSSLYLLFVIFTSRSTWLGSKETHRNKRKTSRKRKTMKG